MTKKDILVIIMTLFGIFLLSYVFYTFGQVLEVLNA